VKNETLLHETRWLPFKRRQTTECLFLFIFYKQVSIIFCLQNECRIKLCREVTKIIQKEIIEVERKKKKDRNNNNFFKNILPLQSRFPKRGPPFPSPIYSSFSLQRSSLLSKFEKAFEAIRKKR
jgi:hypothetical protein